MHQLLADLFRLHISKFYLAAVQFFLSLSFCSIAMKWHSLCGQRWKRERERERDKNKFFSLLTFLTLFSFSSSPSSSLASLKEKTSIVSILRLELPIIGNRGRREREIANVDLLCNLAYLPTPSRLLVLKEEQTRR